MPVTLMPHFSQYRQNKFALAHNWTITMLPEFLNNPLFAPLVGFLTQMIDGFLGGGVSINCKSSTVPKSKVKIIRDVIHGMSVQQVCGREPTAGEITLTFLDANDLRVFKLFEMLKQLTANRFDNTSTEITIPLLDPIQPEIGEGLVLTMYDDNRWRPMTQYQLIGANCIDVTHSDLVSEEGFVTTTVTIAYLSYLLVDIGLFGAVSLALPDIDLLGQKIPGNDNKNPLKIR